MFEIIGEYMNKGYVKRVLENEFIVEEKSLWYLFYYFVFNFKKFGKIRVVFNCILKFGGMFLNN